MSDIMSGVNFYGCDKRLVDAFTKMSGEVDFLIISGYRSQKANDLCGGSKTSQHLLGLAIDFRIKNCHISKWGSYIFKYLPEVKGIGIDVYRNMMHVDLRSSKVIVTWSYNREGKAE